MRRIKDEFSDLPVSRQRKWSLRNQKKRLCIICGERAASGCYCAIHLEAHRLSRKSAA